VSESSSAQTDPLRRRPRRAATLFIFVTIVLDLLAIGMVIPVLPQLIRQVGGLSEKDLILTVGWFGTAWATMQLLSGPVQGALSDRFGRRPVILASNLGMGFNYLMMAVAPSLGWLWAGRIISGICAGSIPAAVAYLADVTPPEKRAASFGLLGAAINLGFALGPALGGLLGTLGPRAPFWAAATLSLLNFLYGVFVLPESLPRDRRAPLDIWRLNPVGALYGLLKTYPALGGLLAVSFLMALAQLGPNNVFVLYTQHRFNWGPANIGLLMSAAGAAGMVVQAGLVPVVIKRVSERTALLAGGALQVLGLMIFALADTGAKFWLAVPLTAMATVAGPAWSAIMSRSVGASEQGRLAGATSSLSSLSFILGPLLFTSAYFAAVDHRQGLPIGTPFLMAAAIMVMALALGAWVTGRPKFRAAAADVAAKPFQSFGD
jgi:DHA1 family tetracycline resistance protein-like MFS transporter